VKFSHDLASRVVAWISALHHVSSNPRLQSRMLLSQACRHENLLNHAEAFITPRMTAPDLPETVINRW